MRLRENSRSASAVATFFPRMSCATRLSFCGLTRSMRATAFASFSESARARAFLPMFVLSALRARASQGRRWRLARGRSRRACSGGTRCPLGFAIRRMAVKDPGGSELPKFVTHHLFGNQHRDVLLPVVD